MWDRFLLVLLFIGGLLAICSTTATGGEEQDSLVPSNVRIRPGEETIDLYWTPPSAIAQASFCVIQYENFDSTVPINIPVSPDVSRFNVSGLGRNTLYLFRLYCQYGDSQGATTNSIAASTRTVSDVICPGSLPNAFLEPSCLYMPTVTLCDYNCIDGYKKSTTPAVYYWNFALKCRDGIWATGLERKGFELQDICIPKALDELCPKDIPNGVLEANCGHGTDWLCDFECNGGYNITSHAWYGFTRSTLMSGKLKEMQNNPDKLLCENGVWKTGYEHLGLDVSHVCVHVDDHTCTDPIPNAMYSSNESSVAYKYGVSTMTGCRAGYHQHALAGRDKPICESGVWFLHTSKYDANITPETLCVPNEPQNTCSRTIPNGRIPGNCTVDCTPSCNEGYHVHVVSGGWQHNPEHHHHVTCEDGRWLTDSQPYNEDNICFPDGGARCNRLFPNGEVTPHSDFYLIDEEGRRSYPSYECNNGFRPHHRVRFLECVAGMLVTWNERFGINISTICSPNA